MNSQWQEFLTQQEAKFDETGAVTQFAHPELERMLIKHGPVMTSLAHQALLRLSGEDAFSFLQGQLTNDLSLVDEKTSQYSAYCDPQGQVLAIFLVFKLNDAFYLSFDQSLKDAITKRLQMFVMRSKVVIEDVADEFIHFGFAGQFADLDIQRRLMVKSKKLMEVAKAEEEGVDQVVTIKVPGPFHRYQVFAPVEQAITAWNQLKLNGDLTNFYDWRLLNIASGIAEVTSATSGQHIAQFLNLEKTDMVSFKKGCYPGQEVIARMHYRGKATKRMLRIHLDDVIEQNPGDILEVIDSNDKIHKLDVISSNPDIFEGTLCLAIGNLRALDAAEGDLKLVATGGLAKIEPLPYLLTDEE